MSSPGPAASLALSTRAAYCAGMSDSIKKRIERPAKDAGGSVDEIPCFVERDGLE